VDDLPEVLPKKWIISTNLVKGIVYQLQETERGGKEFEIYITGFEFKSGRVSLVKNWNSRSFTPSPEPTKCNFQKIRFPRIQKKKKIM